jgi:uncharacterized lipoprotein YmbA
MSFAIMKQLTVLLGVLVCSGCVELGGSSAPSRFYLLTPLAESRDVPGDIGLGLGPIRTPAYLDRPQIVTRVREHRLEVAAFDRWGEPLAESVARVTATNLARLLGTERVQRHPWRDSRSVQVEVEIDLLRFDGTLGDVVTLDAHWRMRSGGAPVQRASYISEPIEGDGYARLAAAMSRALASLAREIADTALRESATP